MLVIVLLLVPVYAISANFGYMRISLIEGDVQIKTPDIDDWGYATVNTPLAEGDQIWTPDGGRVELQLNSGSYIRLSENSALQILSLDKNSSQLYFSQGAAYIYYDAHRRSVIQVDTPDASTRAFGKAIFRIDMSDQYTDVAVYKGYVETENQVGNVRIKAGQMVYLGQNTYGELAPMGPSDDWEIWNKMRNDRLAARKGTSSRHLPVELRAYSHDFDDSGRWVQVSGYGNVWTPTVSVSVGWSPYREGRWIWRGGDYIWVGSESWGWAPYHYGRWSFRTNIGWFWVPPVTREVYWSPGYVGWVRTADYVAWVPLAPGEIYYGRGNYGGNSVNITNININQVNITNVYKNVTVNNGVTIVNRNTFATASPQIVKVDQGTIQQRIFTKNNVSIGTPEIKPTRESYFASTRTVSEAKLPPPAVKNIQTEQLKQSRPFIKEADKSVLNPGSKPKALPVNSVTVPRTRGKEKQIKLQVIPADKVKTSAPAVSPTDRGEERQLQSEEKRKPVTSEGGPTGRGEKQQVAPAARVKSVPPAVSPTDRGEERQLQSEEKRKPVTSEGGPTGRGEKQQVAPAARVKSVPPAVSPTDRGEERQLQSEEKRKPVTSEGGPTGRGEKQQVKPADRVKPGSPAVSPTDRGEKRQLQSEEKRKPVTSEGGPTGRGEKQQVAPAARVKSVPPAVSPTDRGEERQLQSEEKRKPVTSEGGPTGRGEKQQVKPADRVKPGSSADRGEKEQVQPDMKGKPVIAECGPGQKDEKNPDKCPQKDLNDRKRK
jgi:hypothetical protein